VSQVVTPRYAPNASLTRVINKEGTVRSETRYQTFPSSGFSTTFVYDLSLRQTSKAPPVGNGNAFVTSYDNASGTSVTVTRGPNSAGLTSIVTTNLDGFGRVSGTSNNVGIQTKATYDACGRTSYESYPQSGPPDDLHGTNYVYDALDRLILKTNAFDGSDVTYTYSATNGINVDIQDENNHTTKHTRQAFGDPRESRLATLTDANNKAWQYTYNALGRLTQLTDPETFVRKWAYNAKNQLVSETHLEMDPAPSPCSGGVSICYAYWPAGQLQTRTDAQFVTTTYGYDANDRLTQITRPTTPVNWSIYNTSLDYDASDNRTSLGNGYVSTSFGYDGANRLRTRTDTVGGANYTTTYVPDNNDFLKEVDYPSTNKAVYTPDAESRITKVTNGGTTTYADSIHYHPSGAVKDFLNGNGLTQQFTLDDRYRLKDIYSGFTDPGTGQRHLVYGYDFVGNVASISDTRGAAYNRSFQYDAVDRLGPLVKGIWGSGTYGYSNVGNRTTSSVGTGGTYTYQPSTNRLNTYPGSTPLGYDHNGNTTADGVGGTYAYTPDNLVQTATVAGNVTTYRYDGDNLRKIRTESTGVSHYYVHGPGNQILTEYTDTCVVREYVYLGNRLLAAVKPPLTTVSFVNASTTVLESVGTVPVAIRITTANGSPTACPVTVNYATVDGTANMVSDYVTASDPLTFLTGSASGSTMNIPNGGITIVNDNRYAPTESFSVTLSSPTGGAVIGTPSFETITITDDDGAQPTIAIGNASATQGSSGTTTATFNVTLSGPSELTTTVNYATANGSATAGSDYTAQNGIVTFPPGVTSQPITVTVLGEPANEPPENFVINLSSAVNATIASGQGVGTINNTVVTDLMITKDDQQTTVTAGSQVTYRITVTNKGPVPAERAQVVDQLPSAITGATWTCVGSGGATCTGTGSGNISDAPTFPSGSNVVYTLTGTVSASARGNLTNTATATPGNGIAFDPVPGDNSATDTDSILVPVDLSITKTDGLTAVAPNQAITYTIVASNTGANTNPVTGATVSDVVPGILGGVTWTCVGAAGGSCAASGTGNISDNAVNLPVGATVTYTLHATVASSPSTGLTNTASIAAPTGTSDRDLTNNTASDTDVLFCGSQVTIIPDGRVVKTSIGAGATQSFLAFLTPGASYSVEAKSISGTQAPGTLTVYRGDDGCGTTSTAQARSTAGFDPAEGTSAQRFSFTASGTVTYRITLVNGSGSSIPYQLVLGETTLFSPSWTTNATYDTYYSLKNTTSATINGTLTFFDPSGQPLGSPFALTITPNATVATNTVALGVSRNMTGTVMFTHDGPPGAVMAEAVVANFSLNPPYVQPVKFKPQRELR
jgi:uncharacterized repeat protein (TIGR01451 family)